MQRRAAAAFVALFLVLGGASLSLIATAEAPALDVQGKTLQQGDTFTVAGTEYTVTKVEATESGGGGHGGGGGLSYNVVVEWTNQSARYTAEWENNTTVEFDGKAWRLLVEAGEDPSRFNLRQDINETAILRDDPNAEDETVTVDGDRYVVVHRDGNRTLVPYDEYFPDPEVREYSEGDTVRYDGNETTFAAVSGDGVTRAWHAPKTMSANAGQQGNLSLGDTTYFAYFPSTEGKRVVISDDFGALEAYNHEVERYHEHKNGLWGISILSGLTSLLVLGMAYLPSRY